MSAEALDWAVLFGLFCIVGIVIGCIAGIQERKRRHSEDYANRWRIRRMF